MKRTDQPAIRVRERRPRRRAAFTLIELLVVIAIIGVLVALLLPAMQSARQRTYHAVCANNLRQLGVAIRAYSGDHGGDFLGIYTPSWAKGGGSGWFSFLGRAGYIGQQVSFVKKHVDSRYGGLTTNWRWPVLRCPAEPTINYMIPSDYYSGVPYNNYLNEYVTSSYDMNFTAINITLCGWCYWGPCGVCTAFNFMTPTAPGATTANSLIVMDNAFCNNGYTPYAGNSYYNYFGISWSLPCFHAYTFGVDYFDYSNIQDIGNDPLRMQAFRHTGRAANGLFLDGHVGQVLPFARTAASQRPVIWIWYTHGSNQGGWQG